MHPFLAPSLLDRCKLVKLGGHTKKAIEPNWQQTYNYFPDSPRILEHVSAGNNYGVMVINNTIVIDCDTKELYDKIPDKWKVSLTTITGKGYHIFLDCPNSPPEKIPIRNPKTKVALGDIRGSNSTFYTVGAGSIHPDTKKKYEYQDKDASLVSVSWSDVENIIKEYVIVIEKSIPKHTSRTGSLSDKLGLRIEDFVMPDNAKKLSNGDIQGAHPIHSSTTGMNFAINPSKNVWHCYRDNVGGDPVAWIAYTECGANEGECTPEQFKQVKIWLRANGYKKQVDLLDCEHFEEQEKNLPPVDISNILHPKNPDLDIDREIKEANNRCLLPPFPTLNAGIFKEYIDFGKRVSYSLEEFHFAALLSIASMAIGRKIVIKVGMTSIYPNVFVMIVGQTTISGKSVACDIAVNNFKKSIIYEEPIAKCYSTNVVSGTISEPALVQGLSDTYNSLWYYDDCAGFFEDVTAWNAHILGTMCSIYDGSMIERTLSKRSKSAEQFKWSCPTPFMSILFNTTTKDIEKISNDRLFSSGFFPRLMWFYGQGGQPRKNADITEDDKKILSDINNKIKSLRESLAPMQNDNIVFGVCDIIEEWKINTTANRLGKEDEAYRTAVSRGFIHAYKIAAILSMFDKSFQKQLLGSLSFPVITKIPDVHAKMAIKIVEQYLIPRTMLVHEMCNAIDSRNHQVIISKALTHLGGSTDRSKLLRQTHLNCRDMDIALSTMVESGEIKICKITHENACKPVSIIIKQ